jgi:hypothetical protein
MPRLAPTPETACLLGEDGIRILEPDVAIDRPADPYRTTPKVDDPNRVRPSALNLKAS